MAPKNRMAKCREEKMKNAEKWKEYLEKDKMRNMSNRAKQTKKLQSNTRLLVEKRVKDKERQRLCRMRKKIKIIIIYLLVGQPMMKWKTLQSIQRH